MCVEICDLGRHLGQIESQEEEVGEIVQWVRCLLCKFGSRALAKAEWVPWATCHPSAAGGGDRDSPEQGGQIIA